MMNLESVRRPQAPRAAKPPASIPLPADLGEWVGRKRLSQLAVSEAWALERESIDRACFPRGARQDDMRWLVALLTFCCAAGIYDSRTIERHFAADARLPRDIRRSDLSADLIRRFRNRNREVISRCLERVCIAAWRQRFGMGTVVFSREMGAFLASHPAGWQWSLLRLEMTCEARERLNQADYADQPGEPVAAWAA